MGEGEIFPAEIANRSRWIYQPLVMQALEIDYRLIHPHAFLFGARRAERQPGAAALPPLHLHRTRFASKMRIIEKGSYAFP